MGPRSGDRAPTDGARAALGAGGASRPPTAPTRPPFSTRPPTLAPPPPPDPAVLRPSPEIWRRRCAALARVAAELPPPAAARLHHRRADVLEDCLAESAAAAAAWSMALVADPAHRPTRVALRGLALSLDDRTLLDRLARGPLLDDDALFLGAAWLLRWPDAQRVRGLLDAVAAQGGATPVLDALAAVALPNAALLDWLSARAATAPLPPALALVLGAALVEAGRGATAAPLLAAPARVDLLAAWLRVEAIGDDPQPLAEALETLARHCELPTAGALRFLAAERLGGLGPWAERLYTEADGGTLDDAITLGRLLRLRTQPEGVEAQVRARLADPALTAVLGLRAAQRLAARGEPVRAWGLAREAWVRNPALGGPSLERLAHQTDQLADWARTLARVPAPPQAADRLRHALMHEMALDDAAGALEALGDVELEAGLPALRLVARVADAVDPERRRRAWQQEAQQTEDAERRIDLFTRIARLTLSRPGEADRAMTYLLWALDHDPEHPIALTLLEHVSRLLGRAGPLAEVLEQGLRWRLDAADRAEALRELARITERHGGSPLAVADWLEQALAAQPDDEALVVDLDRCLRAGQAFERVEALYRDRLARPLAEDVRAEIGLRLGHLRGTQLGDAAGAALAFRAALEHAPPGRARLALEAALERLDASARGGASAAPVTPWSPGAPGTGEGATLAEARPLAPSGFAASAATAVLDADGRPAWAVEALGPVHETPVSTDDPGASHGDSFEVEVPLTDETYASFEAGGEPEPSEGPVPAPGSLRPAERSGAATPGARAPRAEPHDAEPSGERGHTARMPELPEDRPAPRRPVSRGPVPQTPPAASQPAASQPAASQPAASPAASAAAWIPAPSLPPLPGPRGLPRAGDHPPATTPHPLAMAGPVPSAGQDDAHDAPAAPAATSGRAADGGFFGPTPSGISAPLAPGGAPGGNAASDPAPEPDAAQRAGQRPPTPGSPTPGWSPHPLAEPTTVDLWPVGQRRLEPMVVPEQGGVPDRGDTPAPVRGGFAAEATVVETGANAHRARLLAGMLGAGRAGGVGFGPGVAPERTQSEAVPPGENPLPGALEPGTLDASQSEPSQATALNLAGAARAGQGPAARHAAEALADFLGEERSRDADDDPARAAVRRKLGRTRSQDLGANWLDHGRDDLAAAIAHLLAADDTDARALAATALGAAYAAAGFEAEAARAWRMALGYRAGDATVEGHLEDLYRRADNHRALAELLAGRAHRTGDKARRQALLLEVARLHRGPLDDPGAAVPAYREALAQGGWSPAEVAAVAGELAGCLGAIRKWAEYVEVLAAHRLAEPDALAPEAALALGRVHLHALGDGPAALPYLVRAARALPERADVVAELAEIHAARGEAAAAVDLLEATLARLTDPARGAERADLALRIARIAEARLGDLERAGAAYGRALAEGVRDPGVLERAEELALQARDWPRMVQILQARRAQAAEAGINAADQRDLAVRLGHLYHSRLRQPEPAAEAFVDAYALDGRDDAVFRQARALVDRLQRPDLRARLLEAWQVANGPDHPEALAIGLEHVVALEEAEHAEEAVDAVERLALRHGRDPRVRDARARIHLAAGNWPVVAELARADLAAAEAALARAADATQVDRPDVPLDGRPDGQADARVQALRRLAHAEEVGLRDLPAATEAWQRLLALNPEDGQALAALTRLLEAQKRWGELLDISARELARVTAPRQRAFVLFRMGSLYETHLHDAAGAARCYREALAADARCFPALHGLRDLAVQADDWPAVVTNLHAELDLWDDPKERAAILARVGEIRERRLGDAEGAVKAYVRAIELFPGCVPAARALAGRAMADGRPADAAPLLATLSAQKLDKWPRGERAELFALRGQCALQLGRRREAIESLKLALDFQPTHLEALGALVDAVHAEPPLDEDQVALSQRIDAAEAAAQAADDAPAAARVAVVRGRAAEARADSATAIACYAAAARSQPDDLTVRAPWVALCRAERRVEDAVAVLEDFAAAQAPRSAVDASARDRHVAALLQAGNLWVDAGLPDRALDCFQRARRAAPALREPAWRAVQCLAAVGALPEADAGLARLLALPGLPDVERARYRAFGGHLARLGLGDDAAAEAAWRAALSLDPSAPEPLCALLRLLDGQGDFARIDALLGAHAALVTNPPEGPAGAALSTVLAGIAHRRGQLDTARRLLQPLTRRAGSAATAARLALADVCVEAGDVGQAVALLQANLESDPTDVASLDALAERYEALGETERLYAVLTVRSLYGPLPPARQRRLAVLTSQAEAARDTQQPAALPTDTLLTDVGPPALRSPLLRLWGPLDAALATRFAPLGPPRDPLFGPDAGPEGQGAERVVGRQHPLAPDLARVRALLDLDRVELACAPALRARLRVEPGPVPIIALGAPLLADPADPIVAGRTFLLARAALYVRLGLARLHDLTPAQARQALAMLEDTWRAESPGEGGLGALGQAEESQARQVMRGSTGPLAPQFTGESVRLAVEAAADRVGLLATGALRGAVECLVHTAQMGYDLQRGEDLRWAVRAEPRVADLVRYVLSEGWLRARRAAGLSLKAR